MSSNDDWRIYRIRTNGTERQCISQLGADSLNVSNDGWVYYVNQYDANGVTADHRLYRMRIDGSDHTQISQGKCALPQLEGEWLYYLSQDEKSKGHLYKMHTDGTNVTEVFDYNFFRFLVKDDWVYYVLRDEDKDMFGDGDHMLEKIRLDGTEHQIVSKEPTDYFSLFEDWVYAHTDTEKMFMVTRAFRVRTDGTDWEILTDLGGT